MRYTKDNLPDETKALPDHAQELWLAACNAAFADGGEEKATAAAWAAVKAEYAQADGGGEWMPRTTEKMQLLDAAARMLASTEGGWKWQVQIIEAGLDANNVEYPLTVLHAATPLYEGARVFALAEAQHTANRHPFGKSVRDIVGYISQVKKNSRGLEGTLSIVRSAGWLRDMLTSAWDAGKRDLVGLSHDVLGKATEKQGRRLVSQIVKVDSVDVVYEPAAGGQFLRMAAAKQQGQKEATMIKRLLAALKQQRPDLKAQIEALEAKGDAVTEDEVLNLQASAMVKKTEGDGKVEGMIQQLMSAIDDKNATLAKDLMGQATKKFDEAQKLLACTNALVNDVNESLLPDLSKARLRKRFEGKVFELDELKAAIKDEKEYVDKLTGSGAVEGAGGLRANVTEGEPERLQAALDKLLGADTDEKFKDVPAFSGLRAAYSRLTGDTELRGIPTKEGAKLGEAFMNMMRLPAAYSSSSFSFVLGNAMYRRLIKEYRAVNFREDALISFTRNAENFKTLEIIQVGYFADIPDVNPETSDYVEVTMPTDIEATYAINQKGVILTVTRKAMINDDLKTIVQLVSKLGRAQRRTHAKRAWAKLISNANYKGDSTALFHSNHANLGATGLTADATGIATLTARLKAMYAQVEQNSGEGLALVPKYLAVPRDVLEVAKTLNSSWPGATVPNPHAGLFGANHENIIYHPLFTDANDWYLIADGNEVELLEAAYLNNQREPEFFVADNPVAGQMFVADKIQYKTRHEYEFEIADFRGFDKSVVA